MLRAGVKMELHVLGRTVPFTEPFGNKWKDNLEGISRLFVQETGGSEVRPTREYVCVFKC